MCVSLGSQVVEFFGEIFLFRETLNHDEQVEEQNDELELVTPAPVEQEEVEEQPAQAQNGEKMTKQEWYALPTYIRALQGSSQTEKANA